MKFNSRALIALTLLISGCSTMTRVDHIPQKKEYEERNLVVFFDGTANDEGSYTNISRLYGLVTLQNRHDISATYIKGVGTGAKVFGMAAGWGIGNDVREAYLYLLENYDPEYDQISIFGFSRGAYASRILAALLYVAGLPDVKHLAEDEREALVKDIYRAYKSKERIRKRRQDVADAIAKSWGDKVQYSPQPVTIRFLGLWDTVEALGWPDYTEDINEPNKRYGDQLCNVKEAAHALSLDDNRARIFTPLLLTRKHLHEKCERRDWPDNGQAIHEVWFSGAHSDVGGGYKDTDIDGVSLNWMLYRMEVAGLELVPEGTKVYSDHLGLTHDPEGGLFGLIYKERNRNIPCYTQVKGFSESDCVTTEKGVDYAGTSTALSNPIQIHPSVLDRLCAKMPESHESFWFREKKYQNCISCDKMNRGMVDRQCEQFISVADDDNYEFRAPVKQDTHCDHSVCPEAKEATHGGSKQCNLYHKYIAEQAKQRLSTTYLESPGDGETIVFYADVKNDRTGLHLSKDQKYRFKIDGVENWADCAIISADPFTGRPVLAADSLTGDILSVIGKPITYAPFSGYTELLGVVGDQQFKLGRIANKDGVFSPEEDGELILRANEPRFSGKVYENNSGVLKLTVTTEKR